MKIVLAPNAFKGSLTASEAAAAMAVGVGRACPDAEIVQVPVADGGDGLVDVALEALGGDAHEATVSGPLGAPLAARYCVVPSMCFAAIEMALASGLALLSENQRDAMRASTWGTGQLIAAALNHGVSRIGVGIGGSATTDGGIGMAAALGVRFLDESGDAVEPVAADLGRIRQIDTTGLKPRLKEVRVEAICDVDNPLTGPDGAAAVYGPQKGATPEQVEELDRGLGNLADVIERDLGIDVRGVAGGGAAGGLGAGLCAFLGAELIKGVDFVLDLVGLEDKLAGADLVITGEGQIDFQTVHGKAPAGVGAAARAQGIPCLAIAGGVGDDLGNLHDIGIQAVFSLCPGPVTLATATANADDFLARSAEQVARSFLAGQADR